MQRPHGKRAVTLVGNSIGARVIVKAILHLHKLREARRQELEEEHETMHSPEDSDKEKMEQPKTSRTWGSSLFSSSSKKKVDQSEEVDGKFSLEDFDCLIQDVVLLGTPSTVKTEKWQNIRSIVSGRVVNGYSEKDMVLSLVYRYERWNIQVAGVAPVVGVEGIENLNLSHIIERHTDYCSKMKEVMIAVNLTLPISYEVL